MAALSLCYEKANPVRTKRPRSPLNRLVRALSYQKKTSLLMPLDRRLTALRHGFRSSMYTFYDLSKNDPKDYLPDTAFREATAINGPFYRNILHDKLLFAELMQGAFKSEVFRVPEVFALLKDGQLHLLRARSTQRPAGGSRRRDSETHRRLAGGGYLRRLRAKR